MNKVTTVLLAIVLSIPAIAIAQSNSQQDDSQRAQEEANQAAQTSMTGTNTQPRHSMSGMVSNEGKTLTSGNTAYLVDNPKSLSKYDNQPVSVEYVFNTDDNTVHIITVTPGGSAQ
jgi:hypothetical protein